MQFCFVFYYPFLSQSFHQTHFKNINCSFSSLLSSCCCVCICAVPLFCFAVLPGFFSVSFSACVAAVLPFVFFFYRVSSCWVEMTTVWILRGTMAPLSFLYSTVTWVFPSGRSHGQVLFSLL